jgi:hypothetical protein
MEETVYLRKFSVNGKFAFSSHDGQAASLYTVMRNSSGRPLMVPSRLLQYLCCLLREDRVADLGGMDAVPEQERIRWTSHSARPTSRRC